MHFHVQCLINGIVPDQLGFGAASASREGNGGSSR
jgi:hypothetical protein